MYEKFHQNCAEGGITPGPPQAVAVASRKLNKDPPDGVTCVDPFWYSSDRPFKPCFFFCVWPAVGKGRRSDHLFSCCIPRTMPASKPGYVGLCSSPHTHTPKPTFSKGFWKGNCVFLFSLLEFDTLDRRDGILSQGRDVIRGLSRARNLLVSRTVRDVRARTHWLENDDPKEISTQVEHLSLEISSFETHSQQQHEEGFLKTGNDCHFHSSNFTRGWTRGGDGGQNSSRAWDYLAMRAGANQYRWLRSRRNVLRLTCRRNPWCSLA